MSPFQDAWNILKSNVYNAARRSTLPAYHPAIMGMMERRYLTGEAGPFEGFEPSDVHPNEQSPFRVNNIANMRADELRGRIQRQSVPKVMPYTDSPSDENIDRESREQLLRESRPQFR